MKPDIGRGPGPRTGPPRTRRIGLLAVLALVALTGACATAKRGALLVTDHHLGMARGAIDILSGEAEARERRMEDLRVGLEASREALEGERDPDRLLLLLRRHVVLQDAALAERHCGTRHRPHEPGPSAMGSSDDHTDHTEP